VLRDVMEHAVEVEREMAREAAPRRTGTGGKVLVASCALLLLFSAWSIVFRPAIIWGPDIEAPTPAEAEPNTRFAMFIVAQRLLEYHRKHGVYPASLADVGVIDSTFAYTAADTVFELRAVVGAGPLVFRPGDDLDAILAPVADAIRGKNP